MRAVICGLLALCLGCSRKGTEWIQIDEPFETKDCFPTDKPATGEYGQAVILEMATQIPGRRVYVCSIDIQAETNGPTPGSGVVVVRTTNFQDWEYRFSMPGSDSPEAYHWHEDFTVPVKASAPGVPVSIIVPPTRFARFQVKAYYGFQQRSHLVEVPK